MDTETQKVVEYVLSVTIKRAVVPGDYDTTVDECAAWMDGREAKRALEREVLRALRVLDGDCDCEVMETRTFDEVV